MFVIKYKNLTLDLGNGIKTNNQISYPARGNGPFSGILLIPGSGITYKKETVGFVHNYGSKSSNSQLHFGKYPNINQRGFEVLWYVKRDVGANHTILDTYVWRNVTVNDLIQGSKKALNVLIQQPKVDP